MSSSTHNLVLIAIIGVLLFATSCTGSQPSSPTADPASAPASVFDSDSASASASTATPISLQTQENPAIPASDDDVNFGQSPAAWANCLKDGQDVTFTGGISRETFPGPPNYESIDDGDEPETYWILTVATPNCVVAESIEGGELYEAARSTSRFQLVLTGKEYENQASLVGNRALVSGQLFVGHTGHHHTKALIDVREIGADSGK